jgi:peptide subunit release factor 1 (eRF1)
VSELELEHERSEEHAEVDAAYAAAADGGLAEIGVGRVIRAVNRHAVSRLLINDGAEAEGAICSNCGAISLPAPACPECGQATTPVSELFESLARSVIDAGGSVEHVMAVTTLTVDQVAATLRFPVV